MAKKNPIRIDGIIDCACVIHSSGYSWDYVDRLYNMLNRHLPGGIRFHVYTEASREVPTHMIKHTLTEWPGIAGPRKSWWYKLQLFNPDHYAGNLLYLDLDMVLIRNIDWIRTLNPVKQFWALRDFRYLQRPQVTSINSSMMWWNVSEYSYVWQQFSQSNIEQTCRRLQGDQDYLAQTVDRNRQRFFEDQYFQSYRWQSLDGGFDFQRRKYQSPGTGVTVTSDTAVIVFHGKPNPHESTDPLILQHWQ
jgi:hypothetical protein